MSKLSSKFLSPELIFVIVGFIFGMLLLFKNPPFHSNDEDRHFYFAYYFGQGNIRLDYNEDSSKIGKYLPANLYSTVVSTQGRMFDGDFRFSKADLDIKSKEPLSQDKIFYETLTIHPYFPSYIPSALGIGIGQFINDNPLWLGWWGRMGSLFAYLAAMFFIIRMVPVYKAAFMAFGLTPMVLYQMSSVTHDFGIVISTFYIVALTLVYIFDDKRFVDLKGYLIVLGLIALMNFSKGGYYFVAFLPFAIPASKFKLPFNHWIAKSSFVLFSLSFYKYLSTIINFLVPYKVTTLPPWQRDFKFDQNANFERMYTDVPQFLDNIYTNFMHFKQEYMAGLWGRFGYSYSQMPDLIYIIHGVAIIAIIALDGKAEKPLPLQSRLWAWVSFFATFGLILIGFHAVGPMGNHMMFGFQGRYMIPMFALFMVALYNKSFVVEAWNKYKYIIIGIYSSLIMLYVLDYMDGRFYRP